MKTRLDRPVVVGVDGNEDAARAVRYAAREASARGCGLWIVCAVHESAAYPSVAHLLAGESVVDVGHGIVTDAVTLATEVAPTVEVEGTVVVGSATTLLAEAGRQARLVVLGRRGMGAVEHVFTGSTTIGVIGRATCPVVDVPAGWEPGHGTRRVLAGVDGSPISAAVLECAFDAAAAHDADLAVLHLWDTGRLWSPFGDIHAAQRAWEAEARAAVTGLVDALAPRYPGVRVRVDLELAAPADTLVARSRGVDRLVVGRHGHGGLLAGIVALLPGGVARALVEHALCPVEVVPQPVPGVSPHGRAAAAPPAAAGGPSD